MISFDSIFHFTKAIRFGGKIRFLDPDKGGWYKKDYKRYWGGKKSRSQTLCFAFFNFELFANIEGRPSQTREIDIYCAVLNDNNGSPTEREILVVGANNVIEKLLS